LAFNGNFEHTLDAKHRLTVPSKFRTQLAGSVFLVKGLDRCISVYPEKVYSALTAAALLHRQASGLMAPGQALVPSGTVYQISSPAEDPEIRSGRYASILENLRRRRSVGLASLSSPGTLLGSGMGDVVITDCGRCAQGGLPLPLHPVAVTHYLVSYRLALEARPAPAGIEGVSYGGWGWTLPTKLRVLEAVLQELGVFDTPAPAMPVSLSSRDTPSSGKRGVSPDGIRYEALERAFARAERQLGTKWTLKGRGHCERVTLRAYYSRRARLGVRATRPHRREDHEGGSTPTSSLRRTAKWRT
jgi:hypothetical protein